MPSTLPNQVEIRLTPDEALVLFEFLSRSSDSDEWRVEDQVEKKALENLCCLLEKELVEPFHPDYAGLLQAARRRLSDRDDENSVP
jgi:hypothetical protein